MVTQTRRVPRPGRPTTSNLVAASSRRRAARGTAPITVTLAPGRPRPGTYNGTVTIRPTGTSATLNVTVRTRVYAPGHERPRPAGTSTRRPTASTNVAGAIPVTGLGGRRCRRRASRRLPRPVSPASPIRRFPRHRRFIAGSRPDVERLFPNYPLNYRGGWGFMVLTNMLPDRVNNRPAGGNGAFRLHAYAIDLEGLSHVSRREELHGEQRRRRPSRSARIDTPAQGGTVSGNSLRGVRLGAVAARDDSDQRLDDHRVSSTASTSDIRSTTTTAPTSPTLFPGYANSNGAIGYYILNTTPLRERHAHDRVDRLDTLGNTEGIGSRFFTVQNDGGAMTAAAVESSTLAAEAHGSCDRPDGRGGLGSAAPDYSAVEVKKVASDDSTPRARLPGMDGRRFASARSETEQVEVRLANQFDDSPATYEGYVVDRTAACGRCRSARRSTRARASSTGSRARASSAATSSSSSARADGFKTRIPVTVRIAPKYDGEERR